MLQSTEGSRCLAARRPASPRGRHHRCGAALKGHTWVQCCKATLFCYSQVLPTVSIWKLPRLSVHSLIAGGSCPQPTGRAGPHAPWHEARPPSRTAGTEARRRNKVHAPTGTVICHSSKWRNVETGTLQDTGHAAAAQRWPGCCGSIGAWIGACHPQTRPTRTAAHALFGGTEPASMKHIFLANISCSPNSMLSCSPNAMHRSCLQATCPAHIGKPAAHRLCTQGGREATVCHGRAAGPECGCLHPVASQTETSALLHGRTGPPRRQRQGEIEILEQATSSTQRQQPAATSTSIAEVPLKPAAALHPDGRQEAESLRLPCATMMAMHAPGQHIHIMLCMPVRGCAPAPEEQQCTWGRAAGHDVRLHSPGAMLLPSGHGCATAGNQRCRPTRQRIRTPAPCSSCCYQQRSSRQRRRGPGTWRPLGSLPLVRRLDYSWLQKHTGMAILLLPHFTKPQQTAPPALLAQGRRRVRCLGRGRRTKRPASSPRRRNLFHQRTGCRNAPLETAAQGRTKRANAWQMTASTVLQPVVSSSSPQ